MDLAKVWFEKGYLHLKKKEYNLAINSFKHALDYNPLYLDSWIMLGDIYKFKNEYLEAKNSYLHALEIDSNDLNVQLNLSIVYFNLNDIDNAILLINKGLKIDPDNSEFWNQLGIFYDYKGEYEKAIYAYEYALDEPPKKIVKRRLLNVKNKIKKDGLNLEIFNELNDIIDFCNKLLLETLYYKVQLFLKKIENILINHCETYNKNKEYDESIKILNDFLKIFRENTEIWNELGSTYIEKGDYKNAIAVFLKALEITPDNYYFLFYLGYSYFQDKEYKKSILIFNKGLNLYPNDYLAWFFLAKAYESVELYNEALISVEKCLNIDPTYNYAIELHKNLTNFKIKKERDIDLEYKFKDAQLKFNLYKESNERIKASDKILLCEKKIRLYIERELKKHYTTDWWHLGIPEKIRIEAEIARNKRKKIDPKKEFKEIEFLTFDNYKSIILYKKNWNFIFSKIIGDTKKKEIIILFENIIPLRNDLSHGRFGKEDLKRLETNVEGLLKLVH